MVHVTVSNRFGVICFRGSDEVILVISTMPYNDADFQAAPS